MNVRLDSVLLARLDAQCERRVYSRAALIRKALEAFLPDLEDESDALDAEILAERRHG